MLLRNFLDDLNNMYSIPQAMSILDDICIDKNSDDWNFAIDVRGNIENSSIMLRQGTFVTDTFIHKNHYVVFGMKRKPLIYEESELTADVILGKRAKVNYVQLEPFTEMIRLDLN